jgi:hypothetical protein
VKNSASPPDPIIERWLTALARFEATLPRPIAEAMVRNVARGPLGSPLRGLEEHLSVLESLRVEELAGSEARTILAALIQTHERLIALQTRIRQLWSAPG